MQAIRPLDQEIDSRQRISLYPIDFNIPIPVNFSKKIVSSTLIHQRDHLLATERINRSEGDKKIADIRKILSKSLFDKNKKKSTVQKQKLRNYLCGNKLDNLPISPQTQQKSANTFLNLLKSKNNAIQQQPKGKIQSKQSETFKQDANCQITEVDSFLRISQDGYLNCNQQAQKEHNDIRQLLDQKFDNILQHNFVEQGDLSIDIESRFAMKRSKRNKQYTQLIQVCVPDDRVAIHQKLLQQENQYIRQQLIIFTKIVEEERSRVHQYKSKTKTLKKENALLKARNSQFQNEYLHREDNISVIQSQNNEYLREMKKLKEQKILIESKFETILRQYELSLARLQQFEEQKEKVIQFLMEERNKQKQMYIEQLKQKDKDIFQLNEIINYLKSKISAQEEKNKQSKEQKVNTSIDSDKIKQENIDEEELQMSSSICLSLAEAQSLKNIIQEKQQMFQQGIETLKKINVENQHKYLKTVQDLQNKLLLLGKSKTAEIQQIKQFYYLQIQNLKKNNNQKWQMMKKQITEQQEKKEDLLIKQIKFLEEKLKENEKQQDEQLEELLQNCVNQLERERHANFLLRQQFSDERRANYLMREEIEKLKRLFTSELYFIQQIQGKNFVN